MGSGVSLAQAASVKATRDSDDVLADVASYTSIASLLQTSQIVG